MRPMSCRRDAFTLLELLVVITVIVILASLVMGAGKVVQAQSRRAACLSNLRQWGAALQLYVGDNNGALPRRGQGVQMVGVFDRPEDWFNALPPYIDKPPLSEMLIQGLDPKPGERSVFVCPCADKVQKGSRAFLSFIP